MNKPLITAHAGCMNTPQDSLESVIAGIEAGADMIEVDVRVTKDGVVVLFHDEAVMTSIGLKRIRDLTFSEWLEVSDGKVATLKDAITLIKENNRTVNLDVKEDDAIHPMIDLVEKYRMKDYCVISGSEKKRASFIKKHYPSYQVLLDSSIPLYKELKGDYTSFIQRTCQDVIDISCGGLNIYHPLCQEELVEYAKLRCIPVLVWTVDKIEDMGKFLDMGVHSITSNEVNVLKGLRDWS